MTDKQHQRTPAAVAQLLAAMCGTSLRGALTRPRSELFAIDLAAAPGSALAPRWFGLQADGSLVNALEQPVPTHIVDARGAWWCNPPFGRVCLDCGGVSPTPTPKRGKAGPPGCVAEGHRALTMRDWAPVLAAWGARHMGAVLCKFDPSTEAAQVLERAAEAVVQFAGFRVAYEVEVEPGRWAVRAGVNFNSVAYLLGPDGGRGVPPVIRCYPDGRIQARPAGWAVLNRRGCTIRRGPALCPRRGGGGKVAERPVHDDPRVSAVLAGADELDASDPRAVLAAVRKCLTTGRRGELRVRRGWGRDACGVTVEQALAAFRAVGSKRGAATRLGCNRDTVKRRLVTAADERAVAVEVMEALGEPRGRAEALFDAMREEGSMRGVSAWRRLVAAGSDGWECDLSRGEVSDG